MTAILLFWLAGCLFAGCGGPAEKAPAPAAPAPAAAPAADEPGTIQAMRLTNTAQAEYMKRYRRYALTYEELIDARLLTAEPLKDTLGYDVKLKPSPDAGSYRIVAEPVSRDPAARYFFSDKTGTIRAEKGKEATAASPALDPPL